MDPYEKPRSYKVVLNIKEHYIARAVSEGAAEEIAIKMLIAELRRGFWNAELIEEIDEYWVKYPQGD